VTAHLCSCCEHEYTAWTCILCGRPEDNGVCARCVRYFGAWYRCGAGVTCTRCMGEDHTSKNDPLFSTDELRSSCALPNSRAWRAYRWTLVFGQSTRFEHAVLYATHGFALLGDRDWLHVLHVDPTLAASTLELQARWAAAYAAYARTR